MQLRFGRYRLLFSTLVALLTHNSWADTLDLSFHAFHRTYPLGGSAEVNFGYGKVLWGEKPNLETAESSSPIYGYARVAGEIEGVEDYHAGTAKLELFPISFLGIRLGTRQAYSHLDYEDHNCVQYICKTDTTENFAEAQLYLKYWRIIVSAASLQGNWQINNKSSADARTAYIDPASGLRLNADASDKLNRNRYALLFQFNEQYYIGYSETHFDSLDLNQNSYQWIAFFRLHYKPVSFVLGAGEYDSDFTTTERTAYFALSWDVWPKLGY